jgi:hypothetical protein
VTFRGVTLCLALAVAAAACSDDGEPAASTTTVSTVDTTTTTTAPEREPSTTTTAFDPATVEGEVEAAYLRSWDVYAEAVYDLVLDEAALAEVFAGEHLRTKIEEINRRIDNGDAAHVRIEHDYTIELVDSATAIVVDSYQNHQVLIDPATKEPIEEDPDEAVVDAVTVRLLAGTWKVTLKERVGE